MWWLPRFMKKNKGSISLFMAVIMLAMFVISAVVNDGARLRMARTIVQSAADSAALSVLAKYDNNLKDKYGLFTLEESNEDAVVQDFTEFFVANLSSEVPLSNNFEQGIINFMQKMNLAATDTRDAPLDLYDFVLGESSVDLAYSIIEPRVLQTQMAEFTKYRGFVAMADIIDLTDLTKQAEESLEELTKIQNTIMPKLDSNQQLEASEDGTGYKNFVQKTTSEFYDMSSVLRSINMAVNMHLDEEKCGCGYWEGILPTGFFDSIEAEDACLTSPTKNLISASKKLYDNSDDNADYIGELVTKADEIKGKLQEYETKSAEYTAAEQEYNQKYAIYQTANNKYTQAVNISLAIENLEEIKTMENFYNVYKDLLNQSIGYEILLYSDLFNNNAEVYFDIAEIDIFDENNLALLLTYYITNGSDEDKELFIHEFAEKYKNSIISTDATETMGDDVYNLYNEIYNHIESKITELEREICNLDGNATTDAQTALLNLESKNNAAFNDSRTAGNAKEEAENNLDAIKQELSNLRNQWDELVQKKYDIDYGILDVSINDIGDVSNRIKKLLSNEILYLPVNKELGSGFWDTLLENLVNSFYYPFTTQGVEGGIVYARNAYNNVADGLATSLDQTYKYMETIESDLEEDISELDSEIALADDPQEKQNLQTLKSDLSRLLSDMRRYNLLLENDYNLNVKTESVFKVERSNDGSIYLTNGTNHIKELKLDGNPSPDANNDINISLWNDALSSYIELTNIRNESSRGISWWLDKVEAYANDMLEYADIISASGSIGREVYNFHINHYDLDDVTYLTEAISYVISEQADAQVLNTYRTKIKAKDEDFLNNICHKFYIYESTVPTNEESIASKIYKLFKNIDLSEFKNQTGNEADITVEGGDGWEKSLPHYIYYNGYTTESGEESGEVKRYKTEDKFLLKDTEYINTIKNEGNPSQVELDEDSGSRVNYFDDSNLDSLSSLDFGDGTDSQKQSEGFGVLKTFMSGLTNVANDMTEALMVNYYVMSMFKSRVSKTADKWTEFYRGVTDVNNSDGTTTSSSSTSNQGLLDLIKNKPFDMERHDPEKNDLNLFFKEKARETTYFNSEIEYILEGKESQNANNNNVYLKIYGIRMINNVIAMYKDTEIRNLALQASGWAGPFAPLVQIAIIAVLAALETYFDMEHLITYGLKIKFWKEPKDLILSLENLENKIDEIFEVDDPEEIKSKIKSLTAVPNIEDNYTGFMVSYETYLWFFMFLTNRTDKLLRAADLMQLNIRKTDDAEYMMGDHYTYIRCDMTSNIKPMFVGLGFLPSEFADHNKRYNVRTINYQGY